MNPNAGKPATPDMLIDPAKLERAYYDIPATQPVAFGTSGHRGTSTDGSFNEPHILAITQAICDYRIANGISGPLFIGKDTHCSRIPHSERPSKSWQPMASETYMQQNDGATPTPVISRAIIMYNPGPSARRRRRHFAHRTTLQATEASSTIPQTAVPPTRMSPLDPESRQSTDARREPYGEAHTLRVGTKTAMIKSTITLTPTYATSPGRRYGRHPRGPPQHRVGPARRRVARLLGPYQCGVLTKIDVVNRKVDPTFSFMTVDHDGKIRMDCSSPTPWPAWWR